MKYKMKENTVIHWHFVYMDIFSVKLNDKHFRN